jgi:hypothetical protein
MATELQHRWSGLSARLSVLLFSVVLFDVRRDGCLEVAFKTSWCRGHLCFAMLTAVPSLIVENSQITSSAYRSYDELS